VYSRTIGKQEKQKAARNTQFPRGRYAILPASPQLSPIAAPMAGAERKKSRAKPTRSSRSEARTVRGLRKSKKQLECRIHPK